MGQHDESTIITPIISRFLRAILALEDNPAIEPRLMGSIAADLSIARSAVTRLLKRLADRGLVDYQPHRSVRLTSVGRQTAVLEVRRIRLLKCFLMSVLAIGDNEYDADAERLAAHASDRLINEIDRFLKHPEYDSFGDPIPRNDGTWPTRDEISLASVAEGQAFRVVRVLRRDAAFMSWLTDIGSSIGSSGVVLAQMPDAGVTRVRVSGNEVEIGRSASESLVTSTECGEVNS